LARSERELDEWVRRIAPRAVVYARSLLARPQAAEDIVQDVFCRLLEHREYDLLRDGEKLVFRSITNACINETVRRREVLSLDHQNADGAALYEEVPSAVAADPAEQAAGRDVLRAVGRELKALPPMQRAAVELKAMGRSLKEVAEALDVSLQNAAVLVHRGRKALKAKLGALLPGELR
jgi:RNA polymerase sigma factor (sigma-70 family)